MKDVVVQIEPAQDLHGQSDPYPAGGGKNLFDGSAVATTTPNNWGVSFANNVLTIEHKNSYSSGAPLYMLTALPSGTYVVSYTSTQDEKCSLYNGSTYVKLLKNGTTFNVNDGDRIIFSANDNTTNTFTNFQLESGSTATAYAPYSNICPISGWTEANVVRTGVNIWDEEWETGYINNYGDDEDNTFYIRSKGFIPVKPNTQYYFKCPTTYSDYARFRYYDQNKEFVSFIGTSTAMNHPFTTPANAYYMRFTTGEKTGADVTYNNDISINYPSTDHDYHPYAGNTYPIAFPTEAGTVYGGTLDVTNGTLTVDRAMVDLGTLTWRMVTTTNNHWRFVTNFDPVAIASTGSSTPNMACSVYKTVSPDETYLGVTGVSNNTNTHQILCCDERYSDATAFKTTMDGVQLVYPIATPITYNLTPTEIKSLLGDNNIWADCGNTEVTYYVDPTLLLDNKSSEIQNIKSMIAGVESSAVATKNYSIGDLVIVGNTLYEVIAAIASGETISASKVRVTTVDDVIRNRIADSIDTTLT